MMIQEITALGIDVDILYSHAFYMYVIAIKDFPQSRKIWFWVIMILTTGLYMKPPQSMHHSNIFIKWTVSVH